MNKAAPHEGSAARRDAESALRLACSGPVVRRALGYMVVVGAALVAINHGDAILEGDINGNRLWKLALTPLVPYVVSTLSSVSAIRGQGGRDQSPPG